MSPQMRPQARYGMRADGSNVDGNEPGGVNGQMGVMGAPPPATPTPGNLQQRSGPISGGGMAQANMQQAQQTGANIGKAVNRYRQPTPQGGRQQGGNIPVPSVPGEGTNVPPGQAGPNYPMPTPTLPGASTNVPPGQPGPNDPASPAPSNSPLSDQNSDMGDPASSAPPPVNPAPVMPMGAASGQVGAPGSFSGDDSAAPKAAGLGGAMDAMATGGMVTKPTIAMLGEHGPEAVVPLNNPSAKITPGMLPMQKQRYRPMTGPQSVHGPMRPLAPSPVNAQEHPSGWKKYDTSHPRT